MATPYPGELKRLAIERVHQSENSVSQVAQELNISLSTLYNWLKAEKKTISHSKEKYIAAKLEAKLQEALFERDILLKALRIIAKEC